MSYNCSSTKQLNTSFSELTSTIKQQFAGFSNYVDSKIDELKKKIDSLNKELLELEALSANPD